MSSQPLRRPTTVEDEVWQRIRAEVTAEVESEPVLASFLHAVVLNHRRLEDALSFQGSM